MRNRIIVLMIVALFLVGCFGKVTEELDSITLSAGNNNIVAPGESISITAVGKSETGKTIAVEPVWTLDETAKGTISQDNPAVFTAAADASGTVKVTAKVGDISEEITLTIAVPKITNVVAKWGMEFVEQNKVEADGKTQEVKKAGAGDRGGYSNEYFIIGFNVAGQWVEWDMDIPSAGEYRLIARYSTHKDADRIERRFRLREDGKDIEAAYIDKKYELAGGEVSTTEGDWKFYLSEPLTLTAGKQVLRMEFSEIVGGPTNQFSNVLMVGFVAADPAEATFDQAEYIEALEEVATVLAE